jgi:hypothetical protein
MKGLCRAYKKTADSPGGLSGKPLQVLQPLADNSISIGYSDEKVKSKDYVECDHCGKEFSRMEVTP